MSQFAYPFNQTPGAGRYDFTLPEAQWLSDLSGIASDLEAVVRICARANREAQEIENNRAGDALKLLEDRQLLADLVSAAVVRYVRTLGTGVRLGIPPKWLEELPLKLQTSSTYFKALRDKFIAHSVNSLEDNQVFVWLSGASEGRLAVSNISVDKGRFWPGDDDAARLSQLAGTLLVRAKVEIESETQRLLGVARAMPIAEIIRRGSEELPIPKTAHVHRVRASRKS